MKLEYQKVSAFPRGTIFRLLRDGYSFDDRYQQRWEANWRESDAFFYDNLDIADQCCFITTLDGEAIGLVMWDPRNLPEYIELGHNCIATKYKGKGYGRLQLQEAVNRILQTGVKKIIVTTNEALIPAQRNYESVGFRVHQRRENEDSTDHAGGLIDYVLKF